MKSMKNTLRFLFAKFRNLSLINKTIILLIFLLTFSFITYKLYQAGRSSQEEIQTTAVIKGDLVNSVTLSGQIEYSNLIPIYTKASGVVNKVYVQDGQSVKAGDKLAEITLDSEGLNNQASAWAKYLSSKKSVESAKAAQLTSQANMFSEWDQYMDKTEDDNYQDPDSSFRDLPDFQIQEKEWLAAELSFKSQAISLQGAQASLSEAWYNYRLYQSTITTPVNGVVIGLNLAQGLTLSYSEGNAGGASSQIVATLRTEGQPLASFKITEVDINHIKSSQEAVLTFDSFPDKSYPAEVVAVDRIGSVTNGVTQYTVLMRINTDDLEILPNMAVSTTIVFAERQDTLIIPVSAVTQIQDKTIVRILENGKPKPVEVQTGLENDIQAEIISGIKEGDLVIIDSSFPINGKTSDFRQPSSFFPLGGSQGGSGVKLPH